MHLVGVEAVEKVVRVLDEHADELDHIARRHSHSMPTGIDPELRHGVDEHIGLPSLGGDATRTETGGEYRGSRCGRVMQKKVRLQQGGPARRGRGRKGRPHQSVVVRLECGAAHAEEGGEVVLENDRVE